MFLLSQVFLEIRDHICSAHQGALCSHLDRIQIQPQCLTLEGTDDQPQAFPTKPNIHDLSRHTALCLNARRQKAECHCASGSRSCVGETSRVGMIQIGHSTHAWADLGVLWKKAPRAMRAMRGKALEPYHFNRTLGAQKASSKYCQTSTAKQREL